MRLCRFERQNGAEVGIYRDDDVIPLTIICQELGKSLGEVESLIDLLPGGKLRPQMVEIEEQFSDEFAQQHAIPFAELKLLVPVPHPSKLMLLAGNYAKHVEEGGDRAEERERTFPYVFMKPPSTTLTHPGDPVKIPACSPDQIDWELELGVVIGRRCSLVDEANALDYVAGYTVVNDISDRGFRPNPGRTERNRDKFFDWLHGKWHDTFCPMGPCVLPATDVEDPQNIKMTLKVNETVEQDASTAEMVFPVAAVVSFISQFVTLEPGDVISTGTPDGVGKAKGKFLKPGDRLEAQIEKIGKLVNPVEA